MIMPPIIGIAPLVRERVESLFDRPAHSRP